jgi:hypothetical protein
MAVGKYDSFLTNASRSLRFSLYPIIAPTRKKWATEKKLIEDWTESLDDNAEQQLHALTEVTATKQRTLHSSSDLHSGKFVVAIKRKDSDFSLTRSTRNAQNEK